MDFLITFFRDILDGPLYIIVAIISVILICSCIGYLAERSINKKKEKEKYDEEHVKISNTNTPIPEEKEQKIIANSNVNPNPNVAPLTSDLDSSVGVSNPNNLNSPIPESQNSTQSLPSMDANNIMVPPSLNAEAETVNNLTPQSIPEITNGGIPELPPNIGSGQNIDINSMQNISK